MVTAGVTAPGAVVRKGITAALGRRLVEAAPRPASVAPAGELRRRGQGAGASLQLGAHHLEARQLGAGQPPPRRHLDL